MQITYHQQRFIAGLLFVAPALAVAVVFFVYPIALTLRYSFTNWDGLFPQAEWVGLKNFAVVLGERSIKRVFFNTFYLVVLYVPVLNVLAVLIAVHIHNVVRLRNVYKAIMYLPQMLSLTVVGFVWKVIYSYDGGLINEAMILLGLEWYTQDWLGQRNTVLPAMSLTIVWSALGYFILIYLAGLSAIPRELYESADVDGAGPFKQLVFITIPMLAQAITISVTLAAIGILGLFDLPFVLTEGGPGYLSETLALRVYMYAFAQLRIDYGLAMAVILGVISVLAALILLKLFRKREEVYG